MLKALEQSFYNKSQHKRLEPFIINFALQNSAYNQPQSKVRTIEVSTNLFITLTPGIKQQKISLLSLKLNYSKVSL